jgi:hypothetical protein
MRDLSHAAALAAAITLASLHAAAAQDNQTAIAFYGQPQADPEITGSIPPAAGPQPEKRGTGTVERQTNSVSITCLKPELMALIRAASVHFGAPAEITSGFRRGRGSYHSRCMAADVQISGVSPGALARWFRAQPGAGGVGTYGHTRSVHVDVAPRRYSWHHGRRKRVG